MSFRTNGRVKPSEEHEVPAEQIERPDPSARVVTVFRRPDDTICHARCGRPLTLQGVRGGVEADFYCYTCLTHVSFPVSVLEELPVAHGAAVAPAFARS